MQPKAPMHTGAGTSGGSGITKAPAMLTTVFKEGQRRVHNFECNLGQKRMHESVATCPCPAHTKKWKKSLSKSKGMVTVNTAAASASHSRAAARVCHSHLLCAQRQQVGLISLYHSSQVKRDVTTSKWAESSVAQSYSLRRWLTVVALFQQVSLRTIIQEGPASGWSTIFPLKAGKNAILWN